MPKEEAVEPFFRGNVNSVELSSGALKNDILFYDLEKAELIATARPIDFDVTAFDGKLMINMFRYITVAESPKELVELTDTSGLQFSSMQKAEDQWRLQPDTDYILYMGKDDAGQEQGHCKLRYSYDGQVYKIEYAPLNSTKLIAVNLNEGEVFSILFEESTQLPSPADYDIVMGKYLHYFDVEQIEYEVFGALCPSASVKELNGSFANLTAESADSLDWSVSYTDEIGYDWKFYSLDKGAYEIVSNQNFLIKNRNAFYFKFRFTNFYDGIGQSGHPSFEFQLL